MHKIPPHRKIHFIFELLNIKCMLSVSVKIQITSKVLLSAFLTTSEDFYTKYLKIVDTRK